MHTEKNWFLFSVLRCTNTEDDCATFVFTAIIDTRLRVGPVMPAGGSVCVYAVLALPIPGHHVQILCLRYSQTGST